MKAQLYRLFHHQKGKCRYCDGDTWLSNGGHETWQQVQKRLGIARNQYASAKGFKKVFYHIQAMIDRVERRDGATVSAESIMVCTFCAGRRSDTRAKGTERSFEDHRADMQAMARGGIHSTNRGNWPSLKKKDDAA